MSKLTAEHKEAVRKTIIQRIAEEEPDACTAQRDRFEKHLGKMERKAEEKGWGARGEWPGDADRTYEDIDFYVREFDALKDTPKAQAARMVKMFRAGMSVDEAFKVTMPDGV